MDERFHMIYFRYFAIVHPLKTSVWIKSHHTLNVCLVLILGLICGSSQLYLSEAVPFQHSEQTLYDCKETFNAEAGKVYTVFVFLITFVLPMILMSFMYTCMGITIGRHNLPGNPNL